MSQDHSDPVLHSILIITKLVPFQCAPPFFRCRAVQFVGKIRCMSLKSLEHQIGHTPLIFLKKLSRLTGCKIYGKAEFLNPGGSIKDRTALGIIQAAIQDGHVEDGTTVYEGTAGNTGIGLAMLASVYNYKCKIVMPDNQAEEKYQTLEAYGAEVIKVPPVPFANQNHFYHTARRLSEQDKKSFWCNQFENLANHDIHYRTTAHEIWSQSDHQIDVFCSSSGTGGSLSGVSRFLKEQYPKIKVVLVDPMGSGLYNFFKNGEIKSEGSSITEGIGIMRLTENYRKAQIDEAMQVDDHKMINMLYFLARQEGLLVGTSAALNVQAAYEIAMNNKDSGMTIVTLLCDSGLRYQSKIFNPLWLKEKGLNPSEQIYL